MARFQRNSTPVRLKRDPCLRAFFVDPWPRPLDGLTTVRCSLDGGGTGPTTLKKTKERLLYDAFDGIAPEQLAIPLALLPATQQLLDRSSVPFQGHKALYGLAALPEPIRTHPNREPCWLSSVLQWIQRFPEMRVICDRNGPSEMDIIKWLVWSFPTATIAVICENRQTCGNIANSLQQVASDVVELSGGGTREEVHRIVVSTFYGGLATQDFEKRDIIVFPNARHAIGERGRLAMQQAVRARLVGLHRADEQFSQWDFDWLTAIFGFRWLHLPILTDPAELLGREMNSEVFHQRVRAFLARRPKGRYGK